MNGLLRILCVASLVFVLSGCNSSGKSGAQQKYNDSAQPVGYYSNDKQNKGKNMTWNDNHGPILKMMNHSLGKTNNSGTIYTNRVDLDEARIKRAAASVNNVKEVQSVALGTSVVISVNLDDKRKAEKTKVQIMEAVKPYLAGRTCTIITDKGTFNRKINRHNDLLEGGVR
ncbi:MAG: YhcN/YlaJ family sporulation lipoprotein [Bacillota bacterium]|nr:YhcN/YlaJ family sporulation lipoprotein [Bacillota bacterium]